jgi:hypothetical protein
LENLINNFENDSTYRILICEYTEQLEKVEVTEPAKYLGFVYKFLYLKERLNLLHDKCVNNQVRVVLHRPKCYKQSFFEKLKINALRACSEILKHDTTKGINDCYLEILEYLYEEKLITGTEGSMVKKGKNGSVKTVENSSSPKHRQPLKWWGQTNVHVIDVI